MGIVQNFLADGALSDLTKNVEIMGENHLLEALSSATTEGTNWELRAAVSISRWSKRIWMLINQAFGVLVNLSWGNEKMRQSLTSRPSLVDSLSSALVRYSLFLFISVHPC